MTKVKFFQKYVKSQGQGHEVKNFSIDRKVLSQGMNLCNIKALSPFVKKLWSRLSLFWTIRVLRGSFRIALTCIRNLYFVHNLRGITRVIQKPMQRRQYHDEKGIPS